MAFICIIIYVLCGVFTVFSIYEACRAQNELAGQEFENLRDMAAAAGVLGLSSNSFRAEIKEKLMFSRSLQAVIITGPKNFAIAEEKSGGLIRRDMNYPRFNDGLWFLKRTGPAPLVIKDFNNVRISALSTLIDFEDLLDILKKSLPGILIAVVISFFMLISEVLRHQSAPVFNSGGAPDREKAAGPIAREIPAARDVPEAEHNGSAAVTVKEDTPFDGEDDFAGFGGTADINYYLEPELKKAGEENGDISLLSAAWEKEEMPLDILVNSALDIFKEGTRVFEKTPPGIYVIVPGGNIDECFNTSKRFYRDAVAALPPGADSNLYIGISSKAGRVLSAERLVSETESAFEKARETPGQPVVAFKADLKKYNKLIGA